MDRLLSLTALVVFTTLLSPQTTALQLGDSKWILKQAKAQNINAAVLVPGFLTGASEFQSLCDALTEGGLPTVAIPMPAWHWVSCLGGRSSRPILERIDYTVKHLIANEGDITKMPQFKYNLIDAYEDMKANPGGILKVGGTDKIDDFPIVEPRGIFLKPSEDDLPPNKKVALIGHSAGGWISRLYLSSNSYAGRNYDGQRYVHSLVTLGTPHLVAPGPAFEGVRWLQNVELNQPINVRTLAVGGTGLKGDSFGSLTQGAYAFCCPKGSDGSSYDGDGITPIESALALQKAEKLALEGVTHFCWSDIPGAGLIAPELTKDHRDGRPWYGSSGIIDQWAFWVVI